MLPVIPAVYRGTSTQLLLLLAPGPVGSWLDPTSGRAPGDRPRWVNRRVLLSTVALYNRLTVRNESSTVHEVVLAEGANPRRPPSPSQKA